MLKKKLPVIVVNFIEESIKTNEIARIFAIEVNERLREWETQNISMGNR